MRNVKVDYLKAPAFRQRFSAPATCGEFVQGYIDGVDFLVNCPIDLYSTAYLYDHDKDSVSFFDDAVYSKIELLLSNVARKHQTPLSCKFLMRSDIPRSKGMASSTADLCAALAAYCRVHDIRISDEVFFQYLVEVEPSDGSHFSGITHLHHLSGKIIESLPVPDNLRVLVVDCGGEVDTTGFNRAHAHAVYMECPGRIRFALDLLKNGLRNKDHKMIGRATTISAEISQKILFKPQFNDLLALSLYHGALGVNCAHSGTVLGVLYKENVYLQQELINSVLRYFDGSINIIGDFRIIGGGCHEH